MKRMRILIVLFLTSFLVASCTAPVKLTTSPPTDILETPQLFDIPEPDWDAQVKEIALLPFYKAVKRLNNIELVRRFPIEYVRDLHSVDDEYYYTPQPPELTYFTQQGDCDDILTFRMHCLVENGFTNVYAFSIAGLWGLAHSVLLWRTDDTWDVIDIHGNRIPFQAIDEVVAYYGEGENRQWSMYWYRDYQGNLVDKKINPNLTDDQRYWLRLWLPYWYERIN
jgi:predicted transglutaminase-like cysteine proteinase